MRSQPIFVAANPAAAKIDWLLISGAIASWLAPP